MCAKASFIMTSLPARVWTCYGECTGIYVICQTPAYPIVDPAPIDCYRFEISAKQ